MDDVSPEEIEKSKLATEQVELVLRLLSKEESAAQLARRAGISEKTLYRWRDEFLRQEDDPLAKFVRDVHLSIGARKFFHEAQALIAQGNSQQRTAKVYSVGAILCFVALGATLITAQFLLAPIPALIGIALYVHMRRLETSAVEYFQMAIGIQQLIEKALAGGEQSLEEPEP